MCDYSSCLQIRILWEMVLWRFSYRWTTYARKDYLIERGKILLCLVMYVWVGQLTYGCILSCFITAVSRRDRLGGKKVDRLPPDFLQKQDFLKTSSGLPKDFLQNQDFLKTSSGLPPGFLQKQDFLKTSSGLPPGFLQNQDFLKTSSRLPQDFLQTSSRLPPDFLHSSLAMAPIPMREKSELSSLHARQHHADYDNRTPPRCRGCWSD